MKAISTRIVQALPVALMHLIGSILVAACIAAVVFHFWYPYPYSELAGGRHLFLTLILVDVICGPLLTLILFNFQKSKRELLIDFSIILAIQIGALIYGVNVMAQARPLALVYEIDRFRVISRADVYEPELTSSFTWIRPWSFSRVQLLGIRVSRGGGDLVQSMELSMMGVEAGQRPSKWQEYSLSLQTLRERAHPVSVLASQNPVQAAKIAEAVVRSGGIEREIAWLPLVSRHESDWVILLDKTTGSPRAFLRADGFLAAKRQEKEQAL